MEITTTWVTISTIVFTITTFSYPNTAPYYWGFKGFAIILAIVGWFIMFTTPWHH